MQGPGGNDGVRWASQPCRPRRVNEVGLGQNDPLAETTKGFSRHVEEDFRETEAFVMDGAVALHDVSGHVARPDTKLQDVGIGNAQPLNLIEYHVEQGQAWRGRYKTVGPPLNERGIVELVLGANEASHGDRLLHPK